MSKTPKVLALTMGEPGSIASEITLKAWTHFSLQSDLVFFVIGDAALLQQSSPDVAIIPIKSPNEAAMAFATGLPVLPIHLSKPATVGRADPAHAKAVIASIDKAVELAMTRKVDAIVTNPIQKESLYEAGFSFQGHTDYLASLAGGGNTVMMLSSKDLRTVPITVHIAIKDVPKALTKDLIIEQTSKTAHDLTKWFAIKNPRIGITGLNPHAGENGAMGHEEQDIIMPAITQLRDAGINVSDPLPADTVFHQEARANFDVIMCMYHDQALIPVKTLGFHDGVNTTLGLPFVRTSPDHGTALGLAGTGKANASSLIAAINQAGHMAKNRLPSS